MSSLTSAGLPGLRSRFSSTEVAESFQSTPTLSASELMSSPVLGWTSCWRKWMAAQRSFSYRPQPKRSHDKRARQGSPRARGTVGRSDTSNPRHSRTVQGDQRAGDKKSAGAQRLDDRQSLLRELDTYENILRVCGEAALSRHRERRRYGLQRSQGRDARRHREKPRGDANRHGRHPPFRIWRGTFSRRAD